MFRLQALLYISFVHTLVFSDCAVEITSSSTNGSFDYLLYSQRWPITDCVVWMDKNSTNKCTMPEEQNSFIVHGLWPTKNGTSGPNFCKSDIPFNRTELVPIIDDLNERWTNIENGTDSYSFWKHEWKKHGTCASVLPQFDGVYKYFETCLNLNLQYDLRQILSEAGIVPREESYEVDDLISAIFNVYQSNPQICCTIDHDKRTLLSEIRLCFDKNLQVIDCVSVGVNIRDCRGKKSVQYLGNV